MRGPAGTATPGTGCWSVASTVCSFSFGARADVDVEDLVQRTMMSCLQARSNLRTSTSFRAVLFAVARDELIDQRRRRDVVRQDEAPTELVCERTTRSGFALARQRKHRLARALLRLDLELQIATAFTTGRA